MSETPEGKRYAKRKFKENNPNADYSKKDKNQKKKKSKKD